MSVLHLSSLGILSLSLFAATPLAAQGDPRTACREDIKTLCASEYRARDREKVRACIHANVAKTSEGCQVAVKAQMAAMKAKEAKPE